MVADQARTKLEKVFCVFPLFETMDHLYLFPFCKLPSSSLPTLEELDLKVERQEDILNQTTSLNSVKVLEMKSKRRTVITPTSGLQG